jgi:hypothetical protein
MSSIQQIPDPRDSQLSSHVHDFGGAEASLVTGHEYLRCLTCDRLLQPGMMNQPAADVFDFPRAPVWQDAHFQMGLGDRPSPNYYRPQVAPDPRYDRNRPGMKELAELVAANGDGLAVMWPRLAAIERELQQLRRLIAPASRKGFSEQQAMRNPWRPSE